MGVLGPLATTFYTFLPCFFFVFAGAPLVERTAENPVIGGVLYLTTGVVVAAVQDSTIFLERVGFKKRQFAQLMVMLTVSDYS